MPNAQPTCRSCFKFITAHSGKGWSAPFTGQDMAVLEAFVHLAEAWTRADSCGARALEAAMRETLKACQDLPAIHRAFELAIVSASDWGVGAQLWKRITAKPAPSPHERIKGECLGHPTTEGPIGNVVYCDGSCKATRQGVPV